MAPEPPQATGLRLLPRWDCLPLDVPAFAGRTRVTASNRVVCNDTLRSTRRLCAVLTPKKCLLSNLYWNDPALELCHRVYDHTNGAYIEKRACRLRHQGSNACARSFSTRPRRNLLIPTCSIRTPPRKSSILTTGISAWSSMMRCSSLRGWFNLPPPAAGGS